MKKWSLVFALCVVAFTVFTGEAQARRRGGYSTSSSYGGSYAMPTAIDPWLQTIAQQRAQAMADRGMLTHDIHAYISVPSWTGLGVSEGIGSGSASHPSQVSTCVTGSVVVADGAARSHSGTWFRVRLFR